MRARQGRAAVAVTILATLLLPAVTAPAGIRSKLQEIQEARAALERKISAHEAQAGDLKDRIDNLNAQLTDLQIEMNRLNGRIDRIESEVHAAQARIDETQARIDHIKELATEQAIELYKTGATDALEALLDSSSLAELDARAELLGVATQESTGALIRYGRLRVEIQAEHRELFKLKEELTEEIKSRSIVSDRLTDKKAELDAHLSALNIKLQAERDKEGDLQDESDRIQGNLEAIQARNSVERLGTSAQGYIWPINGSVTSPYGYRWGRQHTGIDIDGYTGQPIVASKDGVVVMATYYSGYGLNVVIDHGGGYATLYAHQSRLNVSEGDSVEQGDLIGWVGCTGSCTGDHLHFEVRVNGSPRNPMDYLP